MAVALGQAKTSNGVVVTLVIVSVLFGVVDTSHGQQDTEGTIPKPVLNALKAKKMSLKRSTDSMGTADPCCVRQLACCPSNPQPAMQQIITKLRLHMERSKAQSDLADQKATQDAKRAQVAEATANAAKQSLRKARQQLAAINSTMTHVATQTWKKYQQVLDKGSEDVSQVKAQAAEVLSDAKLEKFKADLRNRAKVRAIKRKIAKMKGQLSQ